MESKKFPEYIRWEDSSLFDRWNFLESVLEEAHIQNCVTVGYVVDENESFIVVAPTISFENGGTGKQVYGTITIPKPAIRNRTKLTENNKFGI